MSSSAWAPALWAMVLVAAGAYGQRAEAPAQGIEHHAWIATRMLEGEGAALFHLPPRGAGAGFGAADAGVARPSQTLSQEPWRVAWHGRRAYLVYKASSGELDIFSLRAAPTGVGGYWATDPATGAVAEPMLRIEGASFEDAACAGDTLLVLARDPSPRLWELRGAGWSEVLLPEEIVAGEPAVLRLVAGSEAPTLLAAAEGRAQRWHLDPGRGWEATALAGERVTPSVHACFESAGDVCVVVGEQEGPLEAWSIGPGLRGRLARIDLAGRLLSVAPLEGGSRVAVLCAERDEAASGRFEPVENWQLVEVSLATGTELYRDGPRSGSPLSGEDIRWLSIGMVAITLGVLFYLLRPGPARDAIVLPPGCALAEPGRRLAGGMLDGALVAGVVSIAFGVPIHHVLLVAPLFESAGGILAFGTFVGIGTAYGTLCEWLTGRTLGKALAGCRVVSALPDRPRMGLMRCGVRNLFRWGLAPWAVLGVGVRDGRHRGDVASGAAVVIDVEEGEGAGS